jgi:DNA-binding MarR family transcriptional regulator
VSDHIDSNLKDWGRVRPDLDLTSWEVTLRVSRIASFIQYQERNYEPFGLNRGGVETIFALRRSPNHKLSPTQLGETTFATSATVTARLDKLQQAGLITRRHDKKDRRGIVVQLTPKGIELSDRIVESVVERRSQQVQGLSQDEKEQLTLLLRKLLEHFESGGDAGGFEGGDDDAKPRKRTRAKAAAGA